MESKILFCCFLWILECDLNTCLVLRCLLSVSFGHIIPPVSNPEGCHRFLFDIKFGIILRVGLYVSCVPKKSHPISASPEEEYSEEGDEGGDAEEKNEEAALKVSWSLFFQL